MDNLKPVELIENIILYLIVTIVTSPGKFTIMSPLITALFPTALGANGLLAQIYFNITEVSYGTICMLHLFLQI